MLKRIIQDKGVYYFPGIVTCPLAGVGTRAPNLSNRLALDDGYSQVTFNSENQTIHLRNTYRYSQKTLVGDLILLGTGLTKEGQTVALAFHTLFEKKGDRFDARPHLHPSVSAKLVAATCEPVTVVLDNGKSEAVALDSGRILKAWKNPPLASRLGRSLIEVKDNVEAEKSRDLLGDVTVSLGLGRFSKSAVRIQVMTSGAKPALNELDVGIWELRITALMNLPAARNHILRALFLLEIADSPLLIKLRDEGIEKGETVIFRLEQGTGSLQLGQMIQPMVNATEVARAYLEFDFVGAILAAQLGCRLAQRQDAQLNRAKTLAL